MYYIYIYSARKRKANMCGKQIRASCKRNWFPTCRSWDETITPSTLLVLRPHMTFLLECTAGYVPLDFPCMEYEIVPKHDQHVG